MRRWPREERCGQLLLSLWWGGLTVYALIVVPIGTELLGSTTQGFVTQRVTQWLNGLAAVAIVATARLVFSGRSRWQQVNWLVLVLSLGCLLEIHRQLDALLIEESRTVIDSERFYEVHRLYLWGTTFQWLSGFGLFWSLLRPRSLADSGPPT